MKEEKEKKEKEEEKEEEEEEEKGHTWPGCYGGMVRLISTVEASVCTLPPGGNVSLLTHVT